MKYLTSKKSVRTLLGLTALAFAFGVAGNAQARGGTAKPPAKNVVSPWIVPTLPDPVTSVAPGLIHGLDVTGFIQDMTTDGCGGTVKVNNLLITVPCNLLVQMPANTLTWNDFVTGLPPLPAPSLTLASQTAYPSFEIQVVGNRVGTQSIAALIFVSQQSMNGGSGYISSIDYSTGNILVDSGDPANPVVIQINDPNGRFGRVQSPDARFSVDDANPTIHSGTGYPMCVPRTLTDPTVPGNPDDPLCPQKNRPAPPCRNFSQAGVAPPVAGELSPPAIGQAYCSQFVMKAASTIAVGTVPLGTLQGLTVLQIATATDPDVRQQAPFEIGDFITWSGTLFKSATAGAPDLISAHTIEAAVGIYTQPGVQPSYVAIGEFGVGTADPLLVSIAGIPQETQDRIFIEVSTTDIRTPVDIYYVDVDAAGVVRNRWVTPYEMTGECNPAVLPMPLTCNGVSGGITTQNTGAQPQRARLRATKAPAGLLSAPSRNVRAMVRSRCTPVATLDQALLDACVAAALAPAGTVANGLGAGQYAAPVFEFIFPENLKPGDPIVPNDLWHLPFLVFGEGGGVGPLTPAPW